MDRQRKNHKNQGMYPAPSSREQSMNEVLKYIARSKFEEAKRKERKKMENRNAQKTRNGFLRKRKRKARGFGPVERRIGEIIDLVKEHHQSFPKDQMDHELSGHDGDENLSMEEEIELYEEKNSVRYVNKGSVTPRLVYEFHEALRNQEIIDEDKKEMNKYYDVILDDEMMKKYERMGVDFFDEPPTREDIIKTYEKIGIFVETDITRSADTSPRRRRDYQPTRPATMPRPAPPDQVYGHPIANRFRWTPPNTPKTGVVPFPQQRARSVGPVRRMRVTDTVQNPNAGFGLPPHHRSQNYRTWV